MITVLKKSWVNFDLWRFNSYSFGCVYSPVSLSFKSRVVLLPQLVFSKKLTPETDCNVYYMLGMTFYFSLIMP